MPRKKNKTYRLEEKNARVWRVFADEIQIGKLVKMYGCVHYTPEHRKETEIFASKEVFMKRLPNLKL